MNAFEMLLALGQEIQEPVRSFFTDYDLVQMLNAGSKEVALVSPPVEEERILPVVEGVREYALKRYFPDIENIKRMTYQNRPMGFLSDLTQARLWTTWATQTSDWSWLFGVDRNAVTLFPIPTVTTITTVSGTVTQESVTIAVTAGTPSTSGAGTGWIVGVGAAPTAWYSIRSVTDTVITIEKPYAEASAAGQALTISSGAIRVWGFRVPPIVRILSTGTVNYSTGTASFLNGSRIVTGAGGALWGREIRPGMEIAIGTPTGTTRPVYWRKIRFRDSTTQLQLEEPYDLEDAVGQSYLIVDPSPFSPHEEWTQPIVLWASARAMRNARRPKGEIEARDQAYRECLDSMRKRASSITMMQTTSNPRVRMPDHDYGSSLFPFGNE